MPEPERTPVTILLVEDDEVIRRSVAMALERYGYRTTVAGDGGANRMAAQAEIFKKSSPSGR